MKHPPGDLPATPTSSLPPNTNIPSTVDSHSAFDACNKQHFTVNNSSNEEGAGPKLLVYNSEGVKTQEHDLTAFLQPSEFALDTTAD